MFLHDARPRWRPTDAGRRRHRGAEEHAERAGERRRLVQRDEGITVGDLNQPNANGARRAGLSRSCCMDAPNSAGGSLPAVTSALPVSPGGKLSNASLDTSAIRATGPGSRRRAAARSRRRCHCPPRSPPAGPAPQGTLRLGKPLPHADTGGQNWVILFVCSRERNHVPPVHRFGRAEAWAKFVRHATG